MGGFFESPYARHVHAALARNCVMEPSDLAPVPVQLVGYERESDVTGDGFGLTPSAQMLDGSDVLFDL